MSCRGRFVFAGTIATGYYFKQQSQLHAVAASSCGELVFRRTKRKGPNSANCSSLGGFVQDGLGITQV
jgi:hypothetical protein